MTKKSYNMPKNSYNDPKKKSRKIRQMTKKKKKYQYFLGIFQELVPKKCKFLIFLFFNWPKTNSANNKKSYNMPETSANEKKTFNMPKNSATEKKSYKITEISILFGYLPSTSYYQKNVFF